MDLRFQHLIMHWIKSWEKHIWYRGIRMNKREYVISELMQDGFIEPVERRIRTGQLLPKKEWESKSIELNFGEKILFEHKKVRMNRDKDGLNGTLFC